MAYTSKLGEGINIPQVTFDLICMVAAPAEDQITSPNFGRF